MTSAYPGALDPLKTDVNGATDTLASVPHDALHNDQAAATKAVQATLGVNPQGTYATVAARMLASMITVILHGADASTIRPEGAVIVLWIGTVDPVNGIATDLLIRSDLL